MIVIYCACVFHGKGECKGDRFAILSLCHLATTLVGTQGFALQWGFLDASLEAPDKLVTFLLFPVIMLVMALVASIWCVSIYFSPDIYGENEIVDNWMIIRVIFIDVVSLFNFI